MSRKANRNRARSKSSRKESDYLRNFRQRLFAPNANYVGLFRALKYSGTRENILTVAQFLQSPNNPFHRLFYGLPFARKYSELTSKPSALFTGDLEKELNWLAISILRYATEISSFVGEGAAFQRAFLLGQYQEADRLLKSLIASFGLSFWTMDKTFILKEMSLGLEANKTYLTELLGDAQNDVLLILLASYFSIRAETKMSTENYRLKLQRVKSLGKDYAAVRDYLVYRLDHSDFEPTTSAIHMLFYEGSLTILDRYLTFLAICQACACRDGNSRKIASEAVQIVDAKVKDPRLDMLLQLYEPGRQIVLDDLSAKVADVLDLYTSGNYKSSLTRSAELLVSDPSTYELYYIYLHSQGYLAQPFEQIFPAHSPAASILERMHSVIARDDVWRSSIDAILKTGTLLWRDPLAYGLYHFYADEMQPNPDYQIFKYALLNANHVNPRFAYIFDDPQQAEVFLDRYRSVRPNSCTVMLLQQLTAMARHDPELKLQASIPETRRTIYQAAIHEREGRTSLAIAELKSLMTKLENGDIPGAHLLIDRVTKTLFRCFITTQALAECTNMVVRTFLRNPTWIRKLPLMDLITAIDNTRPHDVMRQITYPILYSLFHTKPRAIYVAYDNFLSSLGATRPTDLIGSANNLDSEELNYFLQKVCTIDVLACSFHFTGTQDLEEERIRICQFLFRKRSQVLEGILR